MKLKFINLLLASVLLVGSAQVFTSCKDNEADLYVNLKEETLSLGEKLKADEVEIQNLKDGLQQEITDRINAVNALEQKDNELTQKLATLTQKLEDLKNQSAAGDQTVGSQIEGINTQITSILGQIGDNNTAITTIEADIAQLRNDMLTLDAIWDYVNGKLTPYVQGEIDNVKIYIDNKITELNNEYGPKFQDIFDRLDNVEEYVNNLPEQINGILTSIDNLDTRVTDLENGYGDLLQRVIALEIGLGAVQTDLDNLNITVGKLGTTLDALGVKVDGIETNVTNLTKFVNEWTTTYKGIILGMQGDIATLQNGLADVIKTANEALNTANDALSKANNNATTIALLQQNLAEEVTRLEIEIGKKASTEYVNYIKEQFEKQIENINIEIANIYGDIDALDTKINAVQAEALENYRASLQFTMLTCAALRMLIDDNYAELNGKLSGMDVRITDLSNDIVRLDNAIAGKTDASQVNQLIQQALVSVWAAMADFASKADLQALEGTVGDLSVLINSLQGDITDIQGNVTTLSESVDLISETLNALNVQLGNLSWKVTENQRDIEELNAAVRPLLNTVSNLSERVNGIIIQEVYNKVFGNLNTPVGINTKMLLAWWGQIGQYGSEFPTADDGYMYRTLGLTEDDLAYLQSQGLTVEEFNPGEYTMESDGGRGVLGTVYLTVNPANSDLSGKTFNVVNSLGKALPITLNPVPSNHEIKYGYTRGGTDNGFYEAKATISLENRDAINALYVPINDNLASTVKNIIKEGRKSLNSTTMAQLSKALYDQVNGVLPALAVSCSWNEKDVNGVTSTNLATSEYGMAAATFHARNFELLNAIGDTGYSIHIPDFSKLQDKFDVLYDKLAGKIHIDLGVGDFEIKFDKIEIKIDDVTVDFSGVDKNVTGTGETYTEAKDWTFHLNVDVKDTDGNVIGTVDQNVTQKIPVLYASSEVTVNLEGILNQMQKAVQDGLDEVLKGDNGVATNLSKEINDMLTEVATSISTQVKQVFTDMQKSIDTQISDILADIKSEADGGINKILNRVGSITDRLQKVVNKINNVLADPSHYLQPVLVYNLGDHFGIMSTHPTYPSTFVAKTANPGLTLIPTTYTLETVVPVYKKFVAVTKVWSATTGKEEPAVRDAINKVGNLNTVLNPNKYTVGLTLKKGYIYEIVYQAMDYDGIVSGNKYYLQIK